MPTKQTPAADQFAGLGVTPDQFTPAMQVAVKQKWSGLRVDDKVADLRAARDAVTLAAVPTADELRATVLAETFPEFDADELASIKDDDLDAKVAAEVARLKRNAAVNAWRERTKLQAAIDARDLKFAALRAKRGTKVAPPAPGAVTAPAIAGVVNAVAWNAVA